jgi:hypothetical protein
MAESQTVIERLFEYLSARGISPSGLEKRAGLANGYLRNSKGGLGAQKLSDILKACPDLNATWLMTGKGEMSPTANSLDASSQSTTVTSILEDDVVAADEGFVDVDHIDSPGHDDLDHDATSRQPHAKGGRRTTLKRRYLRSVMAQQKINDIEKSMESEDIDADELLKQVESLKNELIDVYRLNYNLTRRVASLRRQLLDLAQMGEKEVQLVTGF